ncbi:MAG: hypothetical protein ACPGRZ_18530 [Alphaproteobacteria bacterium]
MTQISPGRQATPAVSIVSVSARCRRYGVAGVLLSTLFLLITFYFIAQVFDASAMNSYIASFLFVWTFGLPGVAGFFLLRAARLFGKSSAAALRALDRACRVMFVTGLFSLMPFFVALGLPLSVMALNEFPLSELLGPVGFGLWILSALFYYVMIRTERMWRGLVADDRADQAPLRSGTEKGSE